jgi:general secretion pathway protein A
VEWIANPGFSRISALTKLLSLWSAPAPEPAVDPCTVAASHGLRCQQVQGSWLQFINLNLPAMLEFVLPGGERRYAAATRAGHGEIELANLGEAAHFKISDILPSWSGAAVLLWKPSGGDPQILMPGAVSPAISWVRKQLGETVPAGEGGLYDNALKTRIMDFQRSRGLKPDGIIGTLTLLSLQTAGQEAGIPRLDSATP